MSAKPLRTPSTRAGGRGDEVVDLPRGNGDPLDHPPAAPVDDDDGGGVAVSAVGLSACALSHVENVVGEG
jgi:hypothetical protein